MGSSDLVVLGGRRNEGSARDAGMKLRNSSLHINTNYSTLQRLNDWSRDMEQDKADQPDKTSGGASLALSLRLN